MTSEPRDPDEYRERRSYDEIIDEEWIQTQMMYEIAVQLYELRRAIKQSAPP